MFCFKCQCRENAQLADIYRALTALFKKVNHMSTNTDALTAAIPPLQAAVNAAVTLLQNVQTGNPADDAAVGAAVTELQASTTSLAAAVAAATPAP